MVVSGGGSGRRWSIPHSFPPFIARDCQSINLKQVTPEGDLDGQMEPFYPSGLNPLDQPPGLLLSQPSHPHHL